MTLLRDKLTSFRRFVANSYTDAEKQDAINLFLGNFVPLHGLPPLWALDSDYYLHSGDNLHVIACMKCHGVAEGMSCSVSLSAIHLRSAGKGKLSCRFHWLI